MRIRHLATGSYLAVVPELQPGTDDAPLFATALVDAPTPRTEFQLHSNLPSAHDRRILLDDCSVRIEHRFEGAQAALSEAPEPAPAAGGSPRAAGAAGAPLALRGSCSTTARSPCRARRAGASSRAAGSTSRRRPSRGHRRWRAAGRRRGAGPDAARYGLVFSERCTRRPARRVPARGRRRARHAHEPRDAARRALQRGRARAAGAEPPEDVTHAALAMLHQAVTFHTIVGEGADDDDDEGGANGLLKPIDEIDGLKRVAPELLAQPAARRALPDGAALVGRVALSGSRTCPRSRACSSPRSRR